MATFWIMAAAMICVLMGLMVRLMVTRRSYKRKGMEFRRDTVGRSYFDRNRNCSVYTRHVLETIAPGQVLAGLRIPQQGGEALISQAMVHRAGIYVFEIKDYGGTLNGDADSDFWTLDFENGRTENLQNPFLQGGTHIRALQELLEGIPADLFYVYVVFGQRCRLQEPPSAKNMSVVGRADLKTLLEKDLGEKPEALTAEQAEAVLEKLRANALGK